jgi:FlgN protein
MNPSANALVQALQRVAAAMDAESDAVRAGGRAALAEAAERKRDAIEAAEAMLGRRREIVANAGPAERARLKQAGQRMHAAAERNAATLQGALEGTRRLFGCLAEAARQAASTGTYGPDGRPRRTEEAPSTIHRSA